MAPADLVEGLFEGGIRVACVEIGDRTDSLLPEERRSIESARPSRQKEFAAGRWLARQLLEPLGHGSAVLPRAEDRLPIWPAGIVGSVTHSGALCAVAIARASEIALLGLDLEPDEPVKEGLARLVCRDAEHDWIASPDAEERNRRCRIVFSVKEAVYKAFYPRVRRVWSFQDVCVAIDLEGGRFRARLPEDAGLAEITGHVRRRGGWIVAGVDFRA